jgi:type I restriction enzyme M protein
MSDPMATTPMTKTPPTKNQKSLEQTLWDAADKLRGSVESSEYKHVVLSLIFLKFVSDKFEARRAELIALGQGQYADMVEFYTMKNLFYLPPEARWATIQAQAKQEEIALRIDTALHTLEKNNKALRGALPDNYFARLGLEVSKLAALIDLINNITTLPTATGPGVTGPGVTGPGITGPGAAGAPPATQEEDLVGRVYEYFLGSFAATEGKGGRRVLYAQMCGQPDRADDRTLSRQDLRSLLRLRRHVCAVGQVCRQPPGQPEGHFDLRPGADGHHL